MGDSKDSNVINCKDGKADHIVLKTGEFKHVKNFENANNFFTIAFCDYDNLVIKKDSDCKTFYFYDAGTQQSYSFMMDKNSKIVAGVAVDYESKPKYSGILFNDGQSFDQKVPLFEGNEAQKEKLKKFINDKIAGGKEDLVLVSNNVLSEAKNSIAKAEIDFGVGYKSKGSTIANGIRELS